MSKRILERAVLTGLLIGLAVGAAAALAESEQAELVLASGDRLQITVERYPQYGGLFSIHSDGNIQHTLVGTVPAAGRTLEQFQNVFVQSLAVYVKRPRVSLTLVAPGGATPFESSQEPAQVYLFGEVHRPGSYDLLPEMTLIQLMALSGGTIQHEIKDRYGNTQSSGADLKNLAVFRSGGETIRVNLEHIQQTGDQRQNVRLLPGDTIFVPAGLVGTFSVLGDVKRPGAFPIEAKMNLLDALVRAGGFSPNGSLLNIRIVRTEGGDPRTFRVNLWNTLKGGRLEAVPEVQAGDVVFVDHTPFYHWKRFVDSLRGAAVSTESIRIIKDFDERTGGQISDTR